MLMNAFITQKKTRTTAEIECVESKHIASGSGCPKEEGDD